MRGLLAATAVLGVVVIGGLPVLALTLADSETGDSPTAVAERRPGPPPWAHGHGRAGKPDHQGLDDETEGDEGDDRDDTGGGKPGWAQGGDAAPPGWAKHGSGDVPPGWAKHR